MAYIPNTAGQTVGFTMILRRNLKPAVGLAVVVHRRVNGGAWELCTGSVTESGEGGYLYTMLASDCPPGQTQLVMSHPDAISCGVTILPFEGPAGIAAQEEPAGAIDGANVTFTLTFSPAPNTLSVYLNGLRQAEGVGNDFTASGPTLTFEPGMIPQAGDALYATYQR